jgi:hypothetical protein
MLSFIVQNDTMLGVVGPSVIMLRIVKLSVVMLSIVKVSGNAGYHYAEFNYAEYCCAL